MAHPALIQAMSRQPGFHELRQRLPAPGESLRLGGLAGSTPPLLLAGLAEALPQRLWVFIAADPAGAEAAEADLQALMEERQVTLYPQREALPYEAEEPHLEVSGLRVEALEALLARRARILVTTLRALQEQAEIPSELAELRLTLAVGDAAPPYQLAQRLEAMGFTRVPLVEAVGEFALRGGILDLFGFGAAEPVRLEFWGDDIASIRQFEILDQRSTREVPRVDVLPVDLRRVSDATTAAPRPVRRSLLDVLPRDALLVDTVAAAAEEGFRRTWTELLHLHQAERRRGGEPAAPEALFLPPEQALERLSSFGRLTLAAGGAADLRFHTRESEPVDRDMERLSAILRAGAARGEDTFVLCDNTGQLERLEELLGNGGLPPRATLALGTLAHGFVLEGAEPPLRVLTDHEIFRRDRRLRRGRRFHGAAALESLAQLRPGDYVVHLDHGIGRFLGLERVRVAAEEIEALAIEYAQGEILRVPVYRLDLIERWVADREDAAPPRLHRIGGRSWKTLRSKTEQSILQMATELLELYAARQVAEGHAFPADTRWQKEMESSFLYEDTPDQRQATGDVKRDMESRRPMDRLLCGDVGYGKTEVAIRAAFKAAQEGKQAAVLAPTTILVEQHLHTFRQRLAGYPVRIEALSRFRTPREQQQILAAVAEGRVDILIGTHRLLEPDVVFRDFGLLVVDEEQRFGVRHKETLKELKRNIDVLALTATPIPRTLHLSLAGLRDLSRIETPPRDRMPIITHVVPWVDEILEDALRRELDRGGQVFFVHNRVETIAGIAERVQRLLPHAAVGIAHGQLPATQLDRIMRRFLEGEIQVLVTTAIIENGLDVPTANTLLVDRADQFGLAQLYQLRGRVGRSHHRAYCYLVVPDELTPEAERRLRILEHYTELGSGYAIALKDLELRGAGNILGAEQSGFVHAVGMDTYTRLLDEAIRRLRGERAAERFPPPEVALEGGTYFPDGYVPDASQKLHLYRRLARMQHAAEVTVLREELRDRFGPPPPEADRLLAATTLRLLGARIGLERLLLRGREARLNFREGVVPRLASVQGALRDQNIEIEVRRPMPLSLVLRSPATQPLTETLAAALELLASSRARAA
ncbi:MAG: transcription-repair coupling factor [Gemmatimonadetes bacterium]|nr:transcription-repair coupling factor [Gemmatimonadota bacterium]